MPAYGKKISAILAVAVTAILFSLATAARTDKPDHSERSDVTTQSRESYIKKVPKVASTSKTVALVATLVDADRKAKERSAVVEVDVGGLALTDPAATSQAPMANQGHIHYRVDNGPVIATTAPKLSFHGLSKGQHKITISLAGNDHRPLGLEQVLWVTVP